MLFRSLPLILGTICSWFRCMLFFVRVLVQEVKMIASLWVHSASFFRFCSSFVRHKYMRALFAVFCFFCFTRTRVCVCGFLSTYRSGW